MGLVNRFTNLFRSKVHAVLDKAENPEEQLDYLYEKLTGQRKLAVRAIRDTTADRNLIRNELDEQRSEMQRAHDSAKAYRAKALKLEQEGADSTQIERYNDATKRLLADFLKRQKQVEGLEERLEKGNLSVNTLKEKQIDLETKLEELRSRKEQLKSEWRMAKAEERISGSLAGFESDFSDMDLTLGRIEEKVKRKKALAQASTEVLAEQQASTVIDLLLPGGIDTDAAMAQLDKELKTDFALPGSDVAFFCVAVSGGGTWALEESLRGDMLAKLNTVDNQLTQLNEEKTLTQSQFNEIYPQLFTLIRQKGKLVGRDLTAEDVGKAYHQPEYKFPPEDLDFEEAQKLFKGEGLLPG